MKLRQCLMEIFQRLFDFYGPQNWWPGDSPLEISIGAILTQNTNWRNVESALDNLKQRDLLEINKLAEIDELELARLIRPAGYFNIKAKRVKSFVLWLKEMGGFDRLEKIDTGRLRDMLLQVPGIGYETADSILLYALERPVFVVDAYTRRVLERHGITNATKMGYEHLRSLFESNLPKDVRLFNEFHALFVRVGKERCHKKSPKCEGCPIAGVECHEVQVDTFRER